MAQNRRSLERKPSTQRYKAIELTEIAYKNIDEYQSTEIIFKFADGSHYTFNRRDEMHQSVKPTSFYKTGSVKLNDKRRLKRISLDITLKNLRLED